MGSSRLEQQDERNVGFGLPAGALEKTKPGMKAEKPPSRAAQFALDEGHHRFVSPKKKAVPKQPLAARIGKAMKGD